MKSSGCIECWARRVTLFFEVNMPDIALICPHCQQHLDAPSTVAGQTIKCPACSGAFTVPVPVAAVREPLKTKKKTQATSADVDDDDGSEAFNPPPIPTEAKPKDIFIFKYDLPEREPYEGKATMKQKQYLWDMGFREQNVIDELGKKQASYLIDHLLKHHRAVRSYISTGRFFFFCVFVSVVSLALMLAYKGPGIDPLIFQVPLGLSICGALISGIIALDTRHNLRK